MFDSEELDGSRYANLAAAVPTVTAYDAMLAIVEYFEAVAAAPSRFDREKMRALQEVWSRLREIGGREPELAERLRAARDRIRDGREQRRGAPDRDI